MKLTIKERLIITNLLADKIDLAEKTIKRYEKDYKYYTEDRAKWIPGETLGSENSKYAKAIKNSISIAENQIKELQRIIDKVKGE